MFKKFFIDYLQAYSDWCGAKYIKKGVYRKRTEWKVDPNTGAQIGLTEVKEIYLDYRYINIFDRYLQEVNLFDKKRLLLDGSFFNPLTFINRIKKETMDAVEARLVLNNHLGKKCPSKKVQIVYAGLLKYHLDGSGNAESSPGGANISDRKQKPATSTAQKSILSNPVNKSTGDNKTQAEKQKHDTKEVKIINEKFVDRVNVINSVFSRKPALKGEAWSGKGKWPFILKVLSLNSSGGFWTGEITWTNLNAVHKVEGTIKYNKISYKETKFVKKGLAVLGCVYTLDYKDKDRLDGTWTCSTRQKGQVWIDLQ